MKTNHILILLLLLVVVGSAIRFYHLDFQDTNWDEQFTMEFAAPNLSATQVFFNSLSLDYTPPFYYLLAHFSMVVFGQNPTAIRIPSVLFGILLIPVMYLVGKEYKDVIYGLLLAGLTTIFYNLYFYSKYGRSYSMALVWISIAFCFFMRVIKGDKHAGIYFGIFAICSLWTHLYTIIPIGIMVLYLIWKRKAHGGIIAIVICSLPLLTYINIILTTRYVVDIGTNSFGATPYQILFLTPFDIFGYSAIAICLVVAIILWKNRDEKILALIAIMATTMWLSMFILSTKTPMVIHYSIFVLPMLLMVFILPFWEQLKAGGLKTRYLFVAILVVVLELYQIYLMNFIQRGGTF